MNQEHTFYICWSPAISTTFSSVYADVNQAKQQASSLAKKYGTTIYVMMSVGCMVPQETPVTWEETTKESS
jgi:hypothetical protein